MNKFINFNQGKDDTIEPAYLKKNIINTKKNDDTNATYINSPSEFYPDRNLEQINIPDGIISIDTQAFYDCISLKEITLPNSITSIGAAAFIGCLSLKEITIPNSVINIGSAAFRYCNVLEKIIINKPENSISGAPWGAPDSTQIIWTG